MEKTLVKQKNVVNWFEIPVNNLDRAIKFYESLFGYQLKKEDMAQMKMAWFPMIEGVPGTTGGLVKGEGYTPSQTGSVVYFTVENIDQTLNKVNTLGGKILLQKTNIGEWGYIGQFLDTEGNRIALHQYQ